MSQNFDLPQVVVKIKNISNHHLVHHVIQCDRFIAYLEVNQRTT